MHFKAEAAVPFEYETHGGEDVPVFARGPMSHMFNGVKEEHYIAHTMQYAACVGYYKDKCHYEAQVNTGNTVQPIFCLSLFLGLFIWKFKIL